MTTISELEAQGWFVSQEGIDLILSENPEVKNTHDFITAAKDTDLRLLSSKGFNKTNEKVSEIPSPCVLQVLEIRNIAMPSINQIEKPRLLSITFTDGSKKKYKGVEVLGKVECIKLHTPPGTKFFVKKPIEIKDQILLLGPGLLVELGGHVQELVQAWRAGKQFLKRFGGKAAKEGDQDQGPPAFIPFKVKPKQQTDEKSNEKKMSTDNKKSKNEKVNNNLIPKSKKKENNKIGSNDTKLMPQQAVEQVGNNTVRKGKKPKVNRKEKSLEKKKHENNEKKREADDEKSISENSNISEENTKRKKKSDRIRSKKDADVIVQKDELKDELDRKKALEQSTPEPKKKIVEKSDNKKERVKRFDRKRDNMKNDAIEETAEAAEGTNKSEIKGEINKKKENMEKTEIKQQHVDKSDNIEKAERKKNKRKVAKKSEQKVPIENPESEVSLEESLAESSKRKLAVEKSEQKKPREKSKRRISIEKFNQEPTAEKSENGSPSEQLENKKLVEKCESKKPESKKSSNKKPVEKVDGKQSVENADIKQPAQKQERKSRKKSSNRKVSTTAETTEAQTSGDICNNNEAAESNNRKQSGTGSPPLKKDEVVEKMGRSRGRKERKKKTLNDIENRSIVENGAEPVVDQKANSDFPVEKRKRERPQKNSNKMDIGDYNDTKKKLVNHHDEGSNLSINKPNTATAVEESTTNNIAKQIPEPAPASTVLTDKTSIPTPPQAITQPTPPPVFSTPSPEQPVYYNSVGYEDYYYHQQSSYTPAAVDYNMIVPMMDPNTGMAMYGYQQHQQYVQPMFYHHQQQQPYYNQYIPQHQQPQQSPYYDHQQYYQSNNNNSYKGRGRGRGYHNNNRGGHDQ